MEVKVADSIAELLFSKDLVIVPGFGGFVAEEVGADVDQVLGKISPPAKKIKFNDNLIVNDGILSSFLMEKYSLSKLSAEMEIESFVKRANKLLDNREIIVFPNLGRLYKDFQGTFKFLQDNSNHNTDVFGLGDVHARPILRNTALRKNNTNNSGASKSQEEQIKVGPIATTNLRSKPKKKSESNILLAVLMATALFILFAIVLFKDTLFNGQMPAYDSEVIEDLVDQPVAEDEDNDDYDGWDDEGDLIQETEVVQREKEIRDWKEAEIVVGVFGDKKNAELLIKRIIESGYEAVSLDRGTATAVAVRYAFETEQEFNTKFEQVKSAFNPKAWVYSKE
jgi:hypothetical protein